MLYLHQLRVFAFFTNVIKMNIKQYVMHVLDERGEKVEERGEGERVMGEVIPSLKHKKCD